MGERKRYRSALRSERMIREAYVSLAERGQRVSVAAICREADLNRSTFYVHYDCIETLEAELVGTLMDELGAVVSGMVGPNFASDPAPVMGAIGSYVAKNRALFRLLLTSAGAFGFGDDLRTSLLESMGSDGVEGMVRFDYVAGALASVYRTWVLGQYGDVPVEAINEMAARMVRMR